MNGDNIEVKKQFSVDQLNDALMDADDLMARAALPYFVVGETARQMKNGDKLSGDGIDLGVRKNEMVPTAISTINTHQPELKLTGEEEEFEYYWQGVPIRVHIIDPEDGLFKRADQVWYNAWQYQIANPWEEYLKRLDHD